MGIEFNNFDNVNRLKQTQQLKFGQITQKAAESKSAKKADLNSSIFGSRNTGGSSVSGSGKTKTYTTYANKFEAANRMQAQYGQVKNKVVTPGGASISWAAMESRMRAGASSQQASGKGASFLDTITNTLVTKGVETIFGGKNKKAQNADKANADQAKVDNAKTTTEAEDAANQTITDKKAAENQNKTDKQNVAKAEGTNQAAKSQENTALQQKTEAEAAKTEAATQLDTANTNLTTAQNNLTIAETNVTTAEGNLAAERAKVTPENPNTEGIRAAQQKLDEAKAKKTEAEQQLKQAGLEQQRAQESLNQATLNLEQATTQLNNAQQNVTLTGQQLQTAKAQVNLSSDAVQDLSIVQEKAETKVDEMKTNEQTNQSGQANTGNNVRNPENST